MQREMLTARSAWDALVTFIRTLPPPDFPRSQTSLGILTRHLDQEDAQHLICPKTMAFHFALGSISISSQAKRSPHDPK
jgi:hypothetical protein